MDSIYAELSNKNNLSVNFGIPKIDKTSKKITIDIYTNLENLDVKTLKYGWFYNLNQVENLLTNETLGDITNWTYVEHQNGENAFIATCNYTEDAGYYYLCVMIDNKIFWKQEPIVIEEN